MDMNTLARLISHASKEQVAQAMERLPTEALEFAVRFEALGSDVPQRPRGDEAREVPDNEPVGWRYKVLVNKHSTGLPLEALCVGKVDDSNVCALVAAGRAALGIPEDEWQ
jgi:hypothetical protein